MAIDLTKEHILDVREPYEYSGKIEHIPGSPCCRASNSPNTQRANQTPYQVV